MNDNDGKYPASKLQILSFPGSLDPSKNFGEACSSPNSSCSTWAIHRILSHPARLAAVTHSCETEAGFCQCAGELEEQCVFSHPTFNTIQSWLQLQLLT